MTLPKYSTTYKIQIYKLLTLIYHVGCCSGTPDSHRPSRFTTLRQPLPLPHLNMVSPIPIRRPIDQQLFHHRRIFFDLKETRRVLTSLRSFLREVRGLDSTVNRDNGRRCWKRMRWPLQGIGSLHRTGGETKPISCSSYAERIHLRIESITRCGFLWGRWDYT